MKNFIEVGKTEDEQAEQIKKWLKENGPQIVVGIVIGLTAIWGFDYYKNYKNAQAVEARSHYLSIVENPSNTQALTALKENHANSGYIQQAALMMAKHAVSTLNYQGALDHLFPLTNDTNEFISHNAKLRIASIQLELGDYDKALSILENNQNTAFSGLYNHTKGDIYLAKKDTDSAKKYYQLALDQLSNDSELKNLIQIKLNDLN